MKLGLIADIHGNLHALKTVLEALYASNVDLVLCAGDLVGYGALPTSVIQLVRQSNIPCVAGNYDEAVGWNLPTASRTPSSAANEPIKQAALVWTKNNLGSSERDCLRSLPRALSFVLDGLSIAMVHAGPDFTDEWYTPANPAALDRMVARLDADIVIVGHTHQAFEYLATAATLDGDRLVKVINPGAVGRSLDGDTRAAYAVFDTGTRKVELRRIDYDLTGAVRAIDNSGMPPAIARMVAQGVRRVEELNDINTAAV